MGIQRSVSTTLSETCATTLMETVPLLMQVIRADMRAIGATTLSVPQFRTLAFLDRHSGASLSDLADHLGVTAATASATVERLVQQNYVQRLSHPQERRKVVLSLTEVGLQHLQQARSQTRRQIAALLDRLSEDQLLQIDQSLRSLQQIFELRLNDPESSA
ncbi:MarR family winged helix-turn-helix transcriptional regulator [Thermocoleostomius sinensis]|uniref:MarR family transcriptional regulator n=1 Tax=Thermocoleostomius sinensis A174 TaxID=2016057 RepID=A0A9E8ZGF5_9CYAN|nr:MarR family transcriptional regulator [Thermocoleostomius sinensis]WAL61364.1 MarR family transcriptional regulator [Thermocoleostomius sinensis A174]